MKAAASGSEAHPVGESKSSALGAEPELVIDTPGGRFRARFDEQTPVSALEPLVFCAQFLRAGGRFEALCVEVPLECRSPNAPAARDVVGTLLLGLVRIVSEDSVRRAIRRLDQIGGRTWLQRHL